MASKKPHKHFTYNPYHQPNPDQIISLTQGTEEDKQKKPIVRRTVDYHTTIINYLETRAFQRTFRDFKKIYPTSNAIRHMRPIPFEKANEAHGFCTKYVSTSINKHKCAINCLIVKSEHKHYIILALLIINYNNCVSIHIQWSPEGRRLITGNAMGQFTLWNGLKFNFDTILPAHEFPIRRMIWKYDDEILVSSDSRGFIKYWTMNMKNLINKRGHDESINDMVFSPTYCKFASASADGYLKVWDFSSCKTELATRGHGWDVTCIDWHPYKSLIASGSKDNLIKLWCPRSGECVRSLHGHKNTVSCLKINKINGNWLISGSKDQLIKVWDLRMLNKGEFDTIRAEIDELSCLSWHPHYEKLYVAGGKSGDIKYFLIGNSRNKLTGGNKSYSCQAEIHKAHEQIIWDFAWHPLGHILASSSNDQTTRFWTRNRPGDDMNDQYNVNQLTGPSKQAALRQLAIATKHNPLGTGRTTKPLTEIGGVNLEEIINTEENINMEQDNNPKLNPQHPSIANDPLLADNYNVPSNIHPERMRQMGARSNTSKPKPNQSNMGLPGMGAHIPAMAGPPPSHLGPPHTSQQPPPYGQPPIHHSSYRPTVGGPPPVHHPPHSHLGPPPMQQPPPYGQQPRPGMGGPPTHNPYLPMQSDNRYDRGRGGRMDRDRDRGSHRGGRDRRDRRRRDRSRSRERDRDRKSKKGSAVPGLSRIPGLSFGK